MKKELPLLIGLIVGVFALIEFYVPHYFVGEVREELLGYGQILAASAFVLGGLNLLQVNIPKVRRREHDWQYKMILLVGAAVMGLAGSKVWHEATGEPETKAVVAASTMAPSDPSKAAIVIHTAEPDALVKIGSVPPQAARGAGGPLIVEVPPGTHPIIFTMAASGYSEVTGEVTVAAGEAVEVRGTPTMLWGPSGRVYKWIYDHVFAPANATMFALLAFFVASAAFRAFRARNVEAALLLGSAIIILVARAPIGRSIHPWLPELSDWILDIPNNAGRRAIMMGAAIGAIATGLRVILGLERSHLGSD